MNNVHQSLGDYVDDLDERGYPQSKEGRELGTRIFRETQPYSVKHSRFEGNYWRSFGPFCIRRPGGSSGARPRS
jgi:hypothetical protein